MHADHYFSLAGPHAASGTPCQDYALSGVLANGPAHYALVADGSSCAGGVKGETDIGARLLAHAFVVTATHAAKQSLDGLFLAMQDGSLAAKLIQRLMETRFTLEDADLLATLSVLVCDGARICVLSMGDGVIAVKYRDGSLMIQGTTWHGNAPYYPAYQGLGRFLEFGRHHDHHQPSRAAVPVPYEELAVVSVETVHIPAPGDAATIRGDSVIEKLGRHAPFGKAQVFPIEAVDCVAVFSDGVASFRGETGAIALAEAVPRLLAFKNFNGRFVARRAIAALGREFPGPPQDDFSMAAIHIMPR